MLPAKGNEDALFPMFRLHSDLDRLIEDFFKGETALAPFRSNGRLLPAIDVKETDDAVTVDAELPGLKQEEIQVKVEEGVLTISAERKQEKEEKTKTVHRQERQYGRLERRLSLPGTVDGERADASYKDGVLHVTLPKKASAKPKTVAVKVK
jgi:HSP20 family protein